MATKTMRTAKLDSYRRDVENLRTELEEAEELCMKQKREITDLKNNDGEMQAEVTKLQKTKRRLQNEIDQLNAIFEQEKNEIADLEIRLKKQTRALNEERKLTTQLDEDKRDLLKKISNLDSKLESAGVEKRSVEKQLEDAELQKKVLQASNESLTDSRDNARAALHNCEKDKTMLQTQLSEANRLASNLEDECNHLESSLAASAAALQTSKDNHTRDVLARDEKIETARNALAKCERESKLALEEERKKREQMAAARKGLEAQIVNLTNECDQAHVRVEEQQKQIRKQQTQIAQLREVQAELVEMTQVKDNLLRGLKELEKRAKQAELENATLLDQVQTSERAKKAAEEEVSDMLDEVNALKNQHRIDIASEKKLMEEKLNDLQEELNEERAVAQESEQFAKKATKDLEFAQDKLSEQREALKEKEAAKYRLESKVKELESTNERLDSTLREKVRENAEVLEKRMAVLESSLEGEVKERENLMKQLKRAEKSLAEAEAELVDSKDGEDNAKAQVEKLTKKLDLLKRENLEQSDDITRLNQAKLNLQNEVDDRDEAMDQVKKEMARKSLGAASRAASRSRSRMEPLDDDDEYDLED